MLILGVPVGKIDKIEPQPTRAKITFWFDDKYKVPADANAVILSPQLVTSRAIQLTPAYTGGPAMADGAVIRQRPHSGAGGVRRLARATGETHRNLQPTEPAESARWAQFINTTADNLRGQGANIRDTIIKLSQAVSGAR